MSAASELLAAELRARKWKPETEYRFHPIRRWRFDLAFPKARVAIEVNGRGSFGGPGGHSSVQGEINDNEKINAAIEYGWRVLVYPAGRITVRKSGEPGTRLTLIADQIERVLAHESNDNASARVLTTKK